MPNEKDSRTTPADAPKTNGDELRVIGVPRRRVDARAKVTGQTRFADDIFLPRMAHCKLLRSPHPHARIRKIDASRALAHPGVYRSDGERPSHPIRDSTGEPGRASPLRGSRPPCG